jgi:hypothetical protein
MIVDTCQGLLCNGEARLGAQAHQLLHAEGLSNSVSQFLEDGSGVVNVIKPVLPSDHLQFVYQGPFLIGCIDYEMLSTVDHLIHIDRMGKQIFGSESLGKGANIIICPVGMVPVDSGHGVNGVLEQLFDLAVVEDGGVQQVVNVTGFIACIEPHSHDPADADELYRRRIPELRRTRKTGTNSVVEAI